MEFKVISIDIDDEVFSHLEKHAKPYVDTPNMTLRRLLGLTDAQTLPTQSNAVVEVDPDLEALYLQAKASLGSTKASLARTKAPKADLRLLVKSGYLKDGEKLSFLDYQGNVVHKFSAVVSGGDLIYGGQRYSMSNLAKELLGELGFSSTSVRGPAHWANESGKSVKDLWQLNLDKTHEK
ncbi:hypothetical protein [Rhodoferax sp.]|uniref:hypothetical protein n=1 Tax=Rhodoferax sp. TaxID=50421 RepID=UPI002608FD1D|nr:hypothetical protein [Rhodoferax sp.]MDD2918353.1 hypothetical protein [Rhodoferax sp.]